MPSQSDPKHQNPLTGRSAGYDQLPLRLDIITAPDRARLIRIRLLDSSGKSSREQSVSLSQVEAYQFMELLIHLVAQLENDP